MPDAFPVAIALVRALAANRPVLRRRWILDDHIARGAVPYDLIGTGPAVAGAGVAAIASIDLAVGRVDIVPQCAHGPAVVRADVGMCLGGAAIQEHIGPRHQAVHDEIMPPVPGHAALDQTEAAPLHVERIAPPALDL